MPQAHIDATQGVTGETLLGALVDAGASIEGVEQAVRTLGVGTVRLAWARVQRAGRPACLVRVRPPEETPSVPSWPRIRELLSFAALPDGARDCALATLRRLVEAEAAVAGRRVDDLELPEPGVLDVLAIVVGVCAAVHELDLGTITVGEVGVGSGTVETFAGSHPVPAPAVTHLLQPFTVRARPVAAELTTAAGAALVATLARPGLGEPPTTVARTGVGALDRRGPRDARLRVLLAG